MDFLKTQATLDRIGLQPGQHVLEIGAGWGRLLIPASKRVLPGGQVVGLDIARSSINKLKAQAQRDGIKNLTTVLGDATEANFQPDTFDLVYLCTALGEISDRPAALRQCYAAAKRGGVLSITEMFPDPHYQPRLTVRQLAEDAGFKLNAVQGEWHFFTMRFVKM